jgi:opacity protein-like surface antigen
MLNTRRLIRGLLCSLSVIPTIAGAQATDSTKQAIDTTRKQAENFVRDLLHGLVGPNWNAFVHGGVATSERFLLQQAVDPTLGKRSLQTATGYNVGLGAGVDALLHLGLRATFTFSSNNMNYRTDNGNGSNALNMNDVARLKSYTGTVEALRYMLTSRAPISPYGSLGLQLTWWSLDEKTPFVTSAGAGTPFSISPLFSFGVQARATNHWSGRLEAVMASGKNPFTGQHSFQSNLGQTIDEPASINQTAFRLAAVYHFGSPPKVTVPTPAVAQH